LFNKDAAGVSRRLARVFTLHRIAFSAGYMEKLRKACARQQSHVLFSIIRSSLSHLSLGTKRRQHEK
jgi:hypothetical protein